MSVASAPGRAASAASRLLGLLLWAIVIGSIALVALRVLPTLNEYMTIQRAVDKVAGGPDDGAGDPRRVRQAEGHRVLDHVDLVRTEDHLEDDRSSVRTTRRSELVAPVFLLIKIRRAGRADALTKRGRNEDRDSKLDALQRRIGYISARPDCSPSGHASAASAPTERRLEFLGDAVLNLAISSLLFERFGAPTRAT